jgi:hypothetical protein
MFSRPACLVYRLFAAKVNAFAGKAEKRRKLRRGNSPGFPAGSRVQAPKSDSRGIGSVGRFTYKLTLIAAVCGGAGCLGLLKQHPAVWTQPTGDVVFVADGAGDFRVTSATLRRVLAHDGWPGQVETVVWSHGHCRVLKDQLDYIHGRAQGFNLACIIKALQQAHPGFKVYLVGHSAGTVVVVAALEALPPGSIDSVALLAPALSTYYDLRPGLCAVRNHVDVYYSWRDWGYLGLATAIWGTTDRLHAPSAGRVGFQVYDGCDEDRALYARLRQHPWHWRDWCTGNDGGHFGAQQAGYLRRRVVPNLIE